MVLDVYPTRFSTVDLVRSLLIYLTFGEQARRDCLDKHATVILHVPRISPGTKKTPNFQDRKTAFAKFLNFLTGW